MIEAVGIELVSIDKFGRALDRWGNRLLHRLFTEYELAYCLKKRNPLPHLAARFALKASIMKAMGDIVAYRDIEVRADDGGRPSVRVKGERARVVLASISHDGGFALAEAMVVRGQ